MTIHNSYENDGTYGKYYKMQKAGLPQGAIENAMARDSVATPYKFFENVSVEGTKGKPSTPAPTAKPITPAAPRPAAARPAASRPAAASSTGDPVTSPAAPAKSTASGGVMDELKEKMAKREKEKDSPSATSKSPAATTGEAVTVNIKEEGASLHISIASNDNSVNTKLAELFKHWAKEAAGAKDKDFSVLDDSAKSYQFTMPLEIPGGGAKLTAKAFEDEIFKSAIDSYNKDGSSKLITINVNKTSLAGKTTPSAPLTAGHPAPAASAPVATRPSTSSGAKPAAPSTILPKGKGTPTPADPTHGGKFGLKTKKTTTIGKTTTTTETYAEEESAAEKKKKEELAVAQANAKAIATKLYSEKVLPAGKVNALRIIIQNAPKGNIDALQRDICAEFNSTKLGELIKDVIAGKDLADDKIDNSDKLKAAEILNQAKAGLSKVIKDLSTADSKHPAASDYIAMRFGKSPKKTTPSHATGTAAPASASPATAIAKICTNIHTLLSSGKKPSELIEAFHEEADKIAEIDSTSVEMAQIKIALQNIRRALFINEAVEKKPSDLLAILVNNPIIPSKNLYPKYTKDREEYKSPAIALAKSNLADKIRQTVLGAKSAAVGVTTGPLPAPTKQQATLIDNIDTLFTLAIDYANADVIEKQVDAIIGTGLTAKTDRKLLLQHLRSMGVDGFAVGNDHYFSDYIAEKILEHAGKIVDTLVGNMDPRKTTFTLMKKDGGGGGGKPDPVEDEHEIIPASFRTMGRLFDKNYGKKKQTAEFIQSFIKKNQLSWQVIEKAKDQLNNPSSDLSKAVKAVNLKDIKDYKHDTKEETAELLSACVYALHKNKPADFDKKLDTLNEAVQDLIPSTGPDKPKWAKTEGKDYALTRILGHAEQTAGITCEAPKKVAEHTPNQHTEYHFSNSSKLKTNIADTPADAKVKYAQLEFNKLEKVDNEALAREGKDLGDNLILYVGSNEHQDPIELFISLAEHYASYPTPRPQLDVRFIKDPKFQPAPGITPPGTPGRGDIKEASTPEEKQEALDKLKRFMLTSNINGLKDTDDYDSVVKKIRATIGVDEKSEATHNLFSSLKPKEDFRKAIKPSHP